ncbi:hypothetical protein PMIN07_001594 [Paraphaeosphaeria minitans]
MLLVTAKVVAPRENVGLLDDGELLHGAARELVLFTQEVYRLDLGRPRFGPVAAIVLANRRGLLVVFGGLVDAVDAQGARVQAHEHSVACAPSVSVSRADGQGSCIP